LQWAASEHENYSLQSHKKKYGFISEIRVRVQPCLLPFNSQEIKYKDASGKGFSIFGGIIFGGNDRKEKNSDDFGRWPMSLEDFYDDACFMGPKEIHKRKHFLSQNPIQKLNFGKNLQKTVAAIQLFGGWLPMKKIEAKQAKN